MAAPATPSNFNLQTGQQSNYLSWDITATATSYKVYRSLDGVTFTLRATVTGSPLNNFYLDGPYDAGSNPNGVVSATKYYYKIIASNVDGDSPATAVQNIVPAPIGINSLGWIRFMALARADMINSQFISLPEANSYISNSYKWLYDLLIEKFAEEYFSESQYTLTTSQTMNMYPLPADFYKATLVEVALNPGDATSWVTLRKFMKIQQNLWNFPNVYTFYGITNMRYRFTGNSLQIAPFPSSGQTVRITYAPRPRILMADTDLLDGISGWEELVILDAARKMMQKQEQDTAEIMNEIMGVVARIESAAANRDIMEPEVVSDSRLRNFGWTGSGDFGGGGGQGGSSW
jgi:hypothetical protein